MSDHRQLLVRRLIDAINHRDHDALQELIHPDYVYRAPGQELVGLAGLRNLLDSYYLAFPDLKLEIQDMFGEGSRVATAFTFGGTHENELMGLPATGRTVKVHGTIHSRIRDGKIVEEWELLDLASMYQQLGLDGGP